MTEDDYDRALARIHAHADEDARGFTNHAPMAIDALVALGRPEAIDPFLDGYLGDFPAWRAGQPLADAELPGARGRLERGPDWAATWDRRLLQAHDWRPVLGEALAGLAPALFSAAAHGLLRTAHAARSLERRDTSVRRRELGRALGYWCASYQTLPGRPGRAERPDLDVAALIEGLDVVDPEERRFGLFTEGVGVLAARPSFTEAIERLRVPERIDGAAVSDATAAMLDAYLENPGLRIAYVHTITAPSALRLLVPHADETTGRALFGHGVQAMAALHAISSRPTPWRPTAALQALADDEASLRSRAAGSLEEHVIKFVEACLREHAARPDARWRMAAADAVLAHEGAAG